MKSSRKHVARKQRGRPATGQDPVTAIRLSSEMRENVDAWSARQSDEPGRSEAIRRLVELGLASAQRTGARTNKAAKASELQARKLIVWVIRPQPTRNGNSASEDSSRDRKS